jgi:hypothetical protein
METSFNPQMRGRKNFRRLGKPAGKTKVSNPSNPP